MATVIRASVQTGGDTNSRTVMQGLVNNYWGTAAEEKVFPIPFWKLKQLITASSAEEVALRVTDINNPSLVDAQWIVFEEGMESLLASQRPGEYYFVMEQAVFANLRASIPTLTKPLNTIIILGRLGKVVEPPTFTAFFFVSDYELIPPGGGGGGAAAGVRIPPQP